MKKNAKTPVAIAFGQRVRTLRTEQGYSQESFADQVGLDRSYMGGVERGDRNVSLNNINKIALGLKMTLSELFSDIDIP